MKSTVNKRNTASQIFFLFLNWIEISQINKVASALNSDILVFLTALSTSANIEEQLEKKDFLDPKKSKMPCFAESVKNLG